MDGPTQDELLRLLQNCDLSGASQPGSAYSSRTPSPSPSLMSIMCPGYKPINTSDGSHTGTPISTPLMRHSNSDDLQQQQQRQQRQMHTHSLGFLEPGHATRRSGIFNASHSLHQVADRPRATAAVESEMPVSDPCPAEENLQWLISKERPNAPQTYMAVHPPLQLVPDQFMGDSSFDGHDGPVTFSVAVNETNQRKVLPEEDEDPLQLRKVSSDSLAERRPVTGSKPKRSSYSPPVPSAHDQYSTQRPISLDSALSSYSCQNYGSADSDGTLTPHISRPPSSLSNEQEH